MANQQLLWYVAYGPGLDRARVFAALSCGGLAHSGANQGQTHRSKWLGVDQSLVIPGGLKFTVTTPDTGHVSAIYVPGADGEVLARAYLLTVSQFSSLVARLNGKTVSHDLELSSIQHRGYGDVLTGPYGQVRYLGKLDKYLSYTVTPSAWKNARPSPPSSAYIRLLGNGLLRSHELPPLGIGAYIVQWPGADGEFTPADVASIVAPNIKFFTATPS